MEDCIFCKIINREIPSTIVYETENILAFRDINPVAPVHVLIIPKIHIPSIEAINSENAKVLIDIHMAAKEVAKKEGISESGYRLINNCGKNAGQTVKHLHYHLIGGTNLGEKLI